MEIAQKEMGEFDQTRPPLYGSQYANNSLRGDGDDAFHALQDVPRAAPPAVTRGATHSLHDAPRSTLAEGTPPAGYNRIADPESPDHSHIAAVAQTFLVHGEQACALPPARQAQRRFLTK